MKNSAAMEFTSVTPREMTDELRVRWTSLREGNPELCSPLLSLELFEAAAEFVPGLQLAVGRREGVPVVLFPYRVQRGAAWPHLGPLSDLHAAIMAPGESFSPLEMLRQLQLPAWHFHSLLASQTAFAAHHWRQKSLVRIDISGGFEAYRKNRRDARSDELKEGLRKCRKVDRELGGLRFEYGDDVSSDVLPQLLRWKAAQVASRNEFNGLSIPWVRQFLDSLPELRQPSLTGTICGLRIGGRLAAGIAGVRSQGIFQGWLISHDPSLSRYSPGILALCQMLQHCDAMGIRRLDMGDGDLRFKRSFATHRTSVASGVVDRRLLARTFRKPMAGVVNWLGGSSLRGCLRFWVNRRRYQMKRGSA